MSVSNPKKIRESSAAAFKTLYYFILGFAVTEALSKANSGPLTPELIALTVGFIATASRFAHGASILLDDVEGETPRHALCDFFGFMTQAAFLFVMAESITSLPEFALYLVCVLVVDSIWICVGHSRWMGGPKHWRPHVEQWFASNFLLLLITGYIVWAHGATDTGEWLLGGTLIALALLDYKANCEFYFPRDR